MAYDYETSSTLITVIKTLFHEHYGHYSYSHKLAVYNA